MIWMTIALFVVSFLVTALLAPKPEVENARAGSLEDVQFPRATEDAPIPLVLGKIRMNAPNTLWYGDFAAVPITEKIKTGLFSSTRVTVGHQYYLGLDLGLALGPGVELHQIFIDDEEVWSGNSGLSVYTGTISKSELFGGYKKGGGWSGDFDYYPGDFSQPVSTYVESVVGAGGVPGYGGMAHIVFKNNFIGESNQLRKMAFVLSKYTNDLAIPGGSKIGDDLNPMEALYQIFTNDWIGLGVDPSFIDAASWVEAAQTLANEGNGVSMVVTSAQQGKNLITEILRQIDGILYQDAQTSTMKVKLIRNDYDPVTLPVYDESDIIAVRNLSKTAWEDVASQIKVSFSQRNADSTKVAVAQDMATAGMLGRMKTVSMSFPFIYNETLANKIAARELAQQSVPLMRMSLEMNRSGYSLKPGEVFKVSWPEYGLTEVVMRVQQHDLGELLNNKVVVECVQDAFAVGQTVLAPPETSGWTPPVNYPQDVTQFQALDLTAFISRKLSVPEGNSQPLVLAQRPTPSSAGYSHIGGEVSGTYDIEEFSEAPYPPTGTLTAAYPRSAGQLTGVDTGGFAITGRVGSFSAPSSSAQIYKGEAGLLYVNGEWMGFEAVTNGANTASFTTIHRGLFGSPVKDHPLGTRVYQVDPILFGAGTAGALLAQGETWFFKLLDSASGILLSPESATEHTLVMSDELRYPMRPRNLQLDGSRAVQTVTGADATLTWVETNRQTGDTFPTETDPTETPPETTTYDVQVWIAGSRVASLEATNYSGTTYTVPFSTLTGPISSTDCEFRVYARRLHPDNPGSSGDYLSRGYASLSFEVNIP